MALYAEKKQWLETTIILGRVARTKAGVSTAERGHARRYIRISQFRSRFLDKDGLYVSCKPIIDALKTELRRKVDKKFIKYEGAGLIWDDDPSHADWDVTQEKIGSDDTPQVWIEVRIEEAS